MARIQHGNEMHRDGGGAGSGPFEQDVAPNEHRWLFVSGATTLADNAGGDALLILDTGQAFLSGGTGSDSTALTLDSAQVTLDAGAGTTGKHWLTGGVGVVVPVLSADPAGGDSENGQIYYNDSDEKFRVYEDGAWVDMVGGSGVSDILDLPTAETDDTLVLAPDGAGGVEFRAETGGGSDPFTEVVKATNQTVTNNATLQDDTDLQFAVTASSVYLIEFYIIYSGNNASGDFKWGLTYPALSLARQSLGFFEVLNSSDAPTAGTVIGSTTLWPTGFTAGTDAADSKFVLWGKMTLVTNGSGTVKSQFANGTAASGRTSTCYAGSLLRYRKLA